MKFLFAFQFNTPSKHYFYVVTCMLNTDKSLIWVGYRLIIAKNVSVNMCFLTKDMKPHKISKWVPKSFSYHVTSEFIAKKGWNKKLLIRDIITEYAARDVDNSWICFLMLKVYFECSIATTILRYFLDNLCYIFHLYCSDINYPVNCFYSTFGKNMILFS